MDGTAKKRLPKRGRRVTRLFASQNFDGRADAKNLSKGHSNESGEERSVTHEIELARKRKRRMWEIYRHCLRVILKTKLLPDYF